MHHNAWIVLAAAADPRTKEEAARKQMEAVLEKMKLDASQLPEEQRKKLAEDLKVLEGNKDTVEQVLSDLGASLNSVPRGDRDQLKAKLKEEAWLPTKAAIGVRLCWLHPLLCSCALPDSAWTAQTVVVQAAARVALGMFCTRQSFADERDLGPLNN